MTEPVSKINALVQTVELMSFVDKHNSLTQHAKRKKSFVHNAIFFFLLIAYMFMPFQQAVAGDGLTPRSNEFHEKHIVPILKKANICTSMINCRDKEIVFCGSTQTSTFCNFYGITDDKIMKEIIIEIMNSNTLIRGVAFFRSTYRNKGFFEEPIMLYSNKRIGGN